MSLDEITTDRERLGDAARLVLRAILDREPQRAAIAEHALERLDIGGPGDHQDFPHARQHQDRDRIIDHRLVVDGKQMLVDAECHRKQPASGPARQHDTTHQPAPFAIPNVPPSPCVRNQGETEEAGAGGHPPRCLAALTKPRFPGPMNSLAQIARTVPIARTSADVRPWRTIKRSVTAGVPVGRPWGVKGINMIEHDASPGRLGHCQITGSPNLNLEIDLGHQPPCDSLLTAEMLDAPEKTYPLRSDALSRVRGWRISTTSSTAPRFIIRTIRIGAAFRGARALSACLRRSHCGAFRDRVRCAVRRYRIE